MTNQPQLFKVLPGGMTCKRVNPINVARSADKQAAQISYNNFKDNAPTYDLTEQMEDGKVFEGVEVWQYFGDGNWLTEDSEQAYKKYTNFDNYAKAHAWTGYKNRIAIKPIQPVKEEKEVPKEDKVSIGQFLVNEYIKSLPPTLFEMYSKVPNDADILWAKEQIKVCENNLPVTLLQAVDANKDEHDEPLKVLWCKAGDLNYPRFVEWYNSQWQQSQSIDTIVGFVLEWFEANNCKIIQHGAKTKMGFYAKEADLPKIKGDIIKELKK